MGVILFVVGAIVVALGLASLVTAETNSTAIKSAVVMLVGLAICSAGIPFYNAAVAEENRQKQDVCQRAGYLWVNSESMCVTKDGLVVSTP